MRECRRGNATVLADLPVGTAFTVRGVRVSGEVGRRLADMGFTEGAEGVVTRGGAFRGPLQVLIRGYYLLLRRCEAAGIEVEPVGMAPGSSDTTASGRGRGRGWRWAWSGGRGRKNRHGRGFEGDDRAPGGTRLPVASPEPDDRRDSGEGGQA